MHEKEIIAGAMAQILFAGFGVITILSESSLYLGFTDFMTLSFLTYLIFFYSAWLFIPSAIKISDSFRTHPAGIIAAIFGIFSAFVGMVLFALAPFGVHYAPGITYRYASEYIFFPTIFGWLLTFVSDFFLGLMLFMIGWFFLAEEIRFSPRVLWFATGVVYVVAGLLGAGIIITFVTYPLMIVAEIMGAICFIIGKPSDYVSKKLEKITNIGT